MNMVTIIIVLCAFHLNVVRGAPSRIINGDMAIPGEFPFIAQVKLNGYFRCGGFIYNSNSIVTSAICVFGYPVSNFQVVVGQYDVDVVDPGEHTLAVSSVTIHEDFQLSTYKHNIALLRVTPPITLNAYVNLIQLGQIDLSPVANGTVMGWGSQSSNGVASTILMKKTFPMSTLVGCGSYGSEFDPDTMICAGQGSDACTGDAGSPLIQVNSTAVGAPTTAASSPSSEASTTTSSTMPSTISSEQTTTLDPLTTCSTETVQSSTTAGSTTPAASSSTALATDPLPFAVDGCDSSPATELPTDPPPRSSSHLLDTSVVVGIVSHSRVCDNPVYPTIFTNLVAYTNWLAANAGLQT